ncbi:ATP-binding protein [Deltaproteobacteria bacterium IMCC39524]|nr:ATP-binding protein [Deltaproteobacteria bacterium IMCC39524]
MTGIIFLVSMLVMILTSAQFFFIERQHMKSVARDDIVSLGALVSFNARSHMALNDYAGVKNTLESLSIRKDVVTAYLFKPDGLSRVGYSRAKKSRTQTDPVKEIEALELEARQIEEGLQSGAEVFWDEAGRLAHFMPITFEGGHVGYSYVSTEPVKLHERQQLLALGWLLSMGVVMLLTYLLSSHMQRQISRPIAQLVSRMSQVSREKSLLWFETKETDDEFKQLFRGFDEMMRALKERDHLLELQRKDLELEVKVRTRALEAEKEKAEQATASKSRFLANMSHEIRTPMIGILGMADLLRQRSLTEQDQKLVSTIYRSGEALLTILNDLLDFSKIEAGRIELDSVPFDLVRLTEDVTRLMEVSAHDKGLELEVVTSVESSVVMGDPGRLRQVLLNLIGNAVKFTDSGSVSISLEVCDGPEEGECECLFVVRDTGVGIAEDLRSRIFDSFDQGDSSTTRIYGGTGLGLAITRDLIHLMKGEVEVESKPGEGSVFSVHLPMTLSSHSELLHASLPKSTPAAFSDDNPVIEPPANLNNKRRILLAEDNPTTQSLISILMQQMGLDLVIVDNGQSAIDYLTDKKVDLILMDCQMPVLDGFKATAQLRRQGVMTPIVALTAYAREEDEELCLEAGMNGFLSKPFRQSELKEVLLRWLGAEVLPLNAVGKSVND